MPIDLDIVGKEFYWWESEGIIGWQVVRKVINEYKEQEGAEHTTLGNSAGDLY